MNWLWHNKMQWYWAFWILVGFLIPEAYAIITKNFANTLSDTTWRWFQVQKGQPLWSFTLIHFFLLAALLALFLHLGFGLIDKF